VEANENAISYGWLKKEIEAEEEFGKKEEI